MEYGGGSDLAMLDPVDKLVLMGDLLRTQQRGKLRRVRWSGSQGRARVMVGRSDEQLMELSAMLRQVLVLGAVVD